MTVDVSGRLPRSRLGAPRSGRSGSPRRGNFELYAWVLMRVSGVLLVLLVLTHFAIMHVVDGISRVDFAFVSGRWSNPFWRVCDFAMLTLALLHGGNGVRVIIDDYARTGTRRLTYQALSASARPRSSRRTASSSTRGTSAPGSVLTC